MEGSFPAGIVGIYHDDGRGMGKNLKLVVRRLIMGILRIRNNPQHKTVVQKKYFRAYYSGSYALWELDFGRVGQWEVVILLGCVDRLVKGMLHKPLIPKKMVWKNDIAY